MQRTGDFVGGAVIPPEEKPYQEIGDDLRIQIVQGRHSVGSCLPLGCHITETYGVGRTAVRGALLMLELRGTVDTHQGSGVYIMRIPHEDDSEEEQLLSSDIGPFEVLQVRQLLEDSIAAFAVEMATRADIDNLRRIVEQGQRAITLSDTTQNNTRLFHLVLAGVTQDQVLLTTVEWVWLRMNSSPLRQQFNVHIASRTWWLKWLGDRQTLLAALRRHDVTGAWQAMWQRLENVKNSLPELFDEDAPDFDGYLLGSMPTFQEKLV